MTALAEKIRSRGFWEVTVRPTRFDPGRIEDYNRMFPIVRESAVEFRGWDFPHIDTTEGPQRADKWVGQEFDWNHYVEFWRLYRSGQFVFLGGYEEDWRDQSVLWPPRGDWQPGRVLWLHDAVFAITEFAEFASRLAATEAGATEMEVRFRYRGLKGRVLRNDAPNVDPRMFYKPASAEEWTWERSLRQANLLAGAQDLALEAVRDLLARFGLDAPVEDVRSIQVELLEMKRGR